MSQTHITIYWSLDRVLAPLPLSALILTYLRIIIIMLNKVFRLF